MAQFTPNTSFEAIEKEVQARKEKGESAEVIANAAKAVLGESQAGTLATVMLGQGLSPSAVIQAVISVFGATDGVTTSVLNSAKLAGVPENVRNDAAILAGANTTTVLGATAAGGAPAAGGDAGGLGNTAGNFGAPRSTFSSSSGGSAVTTPRSPS